MKKIALGTDSCSTKIWPIFRAAVSFEKSSMLLGIAASSLGSYRKTSEMDKMKPST